MWKLFLFQLLLCMVAFTSCKEDEYVYPPVKLEFLTALSGGNGSLQSLLTDGGERLSVEEDRTQTKIGANSMQRVISNYVQSGAGGAKIYALATVVSPVPEPEGSEIFKDGIKTDPAEVQSIWMGLDYLNIVLLVKGQDGKHFFHFVKEKEYLNEKGKKCIDILLYHDAGNDMPAYTRRTYVSVPLRQYANGINDEIIIKFSYYNTKGERKSWDELFRYIPLEY